eukprot:NODE_4832_length_735_cov_6.406250_g4670_i0.p1 GENE.NODE_4832_length_735_cov_6.406250_g4670_i0~~NODE_4832_length_735_cov_6.406250_g4670_i0.p1  ORF type:complete len:223 (-),score=84.01 NODE_4832_length_735_cov_6.406250_g4670_i0:66-650(-)
MQRTLTPTRLSALTAALESESLSPYDLEAQLEEMGLDPMDENVQALLAAYRPVQSDIDEDDIPEESRTVSPAPDHRSPTRHNPTHPEIEEDELHVEQEQEQRSEEARLGSLGIEIPGELAHIKDIEVKLWLETLHLEHLGAMFEECGISVADIPGLTNASLRMMGVTNPDDCATLLNAISTHQTVEEEIEEEDL